MSGTMTVTIENDEGEEIKHQLPCKKEVCHDCEGEGFVLNASMRNYAYTSSDEEFHDPEFREEYFKRGGIYDVQCPTCKGKNVVDVVDREACNRDPILKGILIIFDKQEEAQEQADAEWRAEQRMERMMLGDY